MTTGGADLVLITGGGILLAFLSSWIGSALESHSHRGRERRRSADLHRR